MDFNKENLNMSDEAWSESIRNQTSLTKKKLIE